MFKIEPNEQGVLHLSGRFDASQEEIAIRFFDQIAESTEVECSRLEYISSAGIGVLIATQKRLMQRNEQLILTNLNPHIIEIFRYAGLDAIFSIR
ncbi:MAG TPA: STAS domain-containing protein [bacterium]|nr:STAS domain-containing protein [bacterium]HOH07702.1 STAS domain-containing protein [bacterium]